MAATQGRRKHNACLLRIRENCPFRKLRKNKCYDIQNVPSQKTGERWAHFNDHPTLAVPPEGSGVAVVYSEPHPPAAFVQPACCVQQVQDHAVMDTDQVNPLATRGNGFTLPPGPSRPVPSPSVLIHQHQRDLPALGCDASMELDSGVDPETGERAQG